MTQITESQVLTELSRHIGRDNGIHVQDLVRHITGHTQVTSMLERRVRQLVTDLRMEGYHICAHPARGYFMAQTPEELAETCEFLYDRAMTSLMQISRMKQISLPDLRGQLHLKT